MHSGDDTHSWFGPSATGTRLGSPGDPLESERLWRGFMTARVTLGLMLLLLQGTIYALGQAADAWLVLICGGYFVAALVVRVASRPTRLGRTFDRQWVSVIGVDVMAFTALQFLQGSNINYTALFALPVLLASVLGSLLLAMGTAAGVTLLLLIHALWMSLGSPGEVAPLFIQSALTGAGSFAIAFLAHQLSARLTSEEQRAQRNQLAARTQQKVNDLVIESLADGILVVDARGTVHAANPAARHMLQADDRPLRHTPFKLDAEAAWQPLADLTQQVFPRSDTSYQADINIQHEGHGPRRMRVSTRLTATQWGDGENLCVMFLEDLREMEARMRTEKLASMGRMSAAVAHEIRNPLAAIAQANALLDEDLVDPRHKQLTLMVQQNSQRLERIVEEVLNIARVGNGTATFESQPLALNEAVSRVCRDWAQQTNCGALMGVNLCTTQPEIDFEPEHLRRVLVNLLDNARRHASRLAESIQVSTLIAASGPVLLGVWSDGPPMEQTVEKHLFEPFFSSQSRSSGLGLYICRELCEGHGATIAYQRSRRIARDSARSGNEFIVSLRRSRSASDDGKPHSQPFTPWP